MVAFDAYAADCRVYGQVDLTEGRLSDQINRTAEVVVRNVQIEDLADGHVITMPELAVGSDELCAVVAHGPRGDVARRLTTRTARVEIHTGPYLVVGRLHGPPTSDPLNLAMRRAAWVPLTEASVRYRRGTDDVKDEVTTLLVNRNLMRSLHAVEETDIDLPWETPRSWKATG